MISLCQQKDMTKLSMSSFLFYFILFLFHHAFHFYFILFYFLANCLMQEHPFCFKT